jgi:hypothetical protein
MSTHFGDNHNEFIGTNPQPGRATYYFADIDNNDTWTFTFRGGWPVTQVHTTLNNDAVSIDSVTRSGDEYTLTFASAADDNPVYVTVERSTFMGRSVT